MALIGAVDRFDPAREIPFPAFAVPTIIGELKKHFRDTAWALHVPRAAAERAQTAQRGIEALTDRTGRSPTVAELAEFLETGIEATLEALEATNARYAVSLDAPAGTDSDDPVNLVELLGSFDERFDAAEARMVLVEGMRALPFQERRALQLRIEQELSQAEIGRRLGCSQMQVSRLLDRAARRLRARLDGTAEGAGAGARDPEPDAPAAAAA